ncbi:MAG: DUF3179 domain-containing protein, partial [Acidobacteriota bacterium]
LLVVAVSASADDASSRDAPTGDTLSGDALVETFFDLGSTDASEAREAVRDVRDAWHPGFAPMSLEIARVAGPEARKRILRMLERQTGERLGSDLDDWWQWVWSHPSADHPSYPLFKSRLYRLLDARFGDYFDVERSHTIRLDEVRWGGVQQDGIPPLRSPKMIGADEATYLDDDHVVFGLEVDGDARAYPKRILAWHEMFTDTLAGIPMAGVYCTLCGTMILYETTDARGVEHRLGTSGFLYRSNKLMYDQATQSLWSTIEGEPVIGPLVGRGIQLRHRAVVTTTWGAWRQRHPETKVLSLDTGHERDYSEGAAYRQYFATDELMFTVPRIDDRLANKAEVLALDLDHADHPPLAIAVAYLREHPIVHEQLGEQRVVVLTDGSGASRVYASDQVRFASWDDESGVVDTTGDRWRLDEAGLHHTDGRTLARLPAHRAFWFGWSAVHADTRLVR